jgi:hypothetical protein
MIFFRGGASFDLFGRKFGHLATLPNVAPQPPTINPAVVPYKCLSSPLGLASTVKQFLK